MHMLTRLGYGHRRTWICLLLLLVITLSFASCKTGEPTTDLSDGAPAPSDASMGLPELSGYVLLRAEEGETYVSKVTLALQTALYNSLGLEIEIITDFTKLYPVTDKEIVIGPTSREGSVYTSTIKEPPVAGGYQIETLDQRYLVHFDDIEGAIAAGEALLKTILPADTAEQVTEVYRKMLEQTNIYSTAITLKSIYADDMLFQQNKPFTITGTASGETGICRAQLLCGDELLQDHPLEVDAESGTFRVTFDGVAGSYKTYTIRIGSEAHYAELKNVLFGELWLATGQSNMAYTLAKDADYADAWYADPYIRVMKVSQPAEGYVSAPLQESDKISWFTGEDKAKMADASAIGYYYCAKLREMLGVPVGMIQYAVGGTPIRSWLSPETIAASPLLTTGELASKYAAPAEWDPAGYRQATALYNSMVAPALGLNIAGVLWYQGEQDLGEHDLHYTEELDLLYRQYSREYGFAEGEMPMIMPIIAPYLVRSRPQFYADFTTALSEYAAKHDKISVIPINDVSPEHMADNVASHPMTKKPTGERLAASAMAMVYGEQGYTAQAPHAESHTVNGNVLTVTFSHVADGLCIADGSSVLRGFTICGADGVYYNADAKIIDKDKVALSSPNVPAPISATYAYELLTYTANLGCTHSGSLLYMASPFALNAPANASHLTQITYADCDLPQIWHLTRDTQHFAMQYDAWWAKTGTTSLAISHNNAIKYQGDAALQIKLPSAGVYTAGPTLIGQSDTGTAVPLYDHTVDYSRYNRLTLQVKNATDAPLRIDLLKIGSYTAAPSVTEIAANSGWTAVTFDLTTMQDSTGTHASSKLLTAVYQILLQFTTAAGGDVYIDDLQFLR